VLFSHAAPDSVNGLQGSQVTPGSG
jgi:hypothetical protein